MSYGDRSPVWKEQGDLGRAINGVISSELSHRKPFKDVALRKVNVMAEVGCHCCVCDFGLTVGLRVVCRRKADRDLQAMTDCFPELSDEEGSSIRDNTVREAMQAPDITKEDLAKVGGVYSGITR